MIRFIIYILIIILIMMLGYNLYKVFIVSYDLLTNDEYKGKWVKINNEWVKIYD